MNIIHNYKSMFKLDYSKYKYILLGESTHGTEDYYIIRKKITEYLIEKYEYNCIFFEMEWSYGYMLNKYIHNNLKISIKNLLKQVFTEYPKWMWCNQHIKNLLLYLKRHNKINKYHKIYIYGTDCQNIELAKKNVCNDKKSLNCSIVNKIINNYAKMKNSSNYWNMRDTMWYNIIEYVKKVRNINNDKFILWAHDSHIGDVRGYQNDANKLNIGYLLKKKYNHKCLNIGFSTFSGQVTASHNWGSKNLVFNVKPATKKSWEYIFHNYCIKNKISSLLFISKKNASNFCFKKSKSYCNRIQKQYKSRKIRYIGVIYSPYSEDISHYTNTDIDIEYDILVFIDNTKALKSFC